MQPRQLKSMLDSGTTHPYLHSNYDWHTAVTGKSTSVQKPPKDITQRRLLEGVKVRDSNQGGLIGGF